MNNRIKQIRMNIVNITRGFYNGSIAMAQGLEEGAEAVFTEFIGLKPEKPSESLVNRLDRIPRNRLGIGSAIAGGLCSLTLIGVLLYQGITKGMDAYVSMGEEKPRIVYFVNGKEVITRNFATNEEMQKYTESEQGREERDYYSSLNSREK